MRLPQVGLFALAAFHGRQHEAALERVEPVLADGTGRARLDRDGQLGLGLLEADKLPEGAKAFRDVAAARLPLLQISSLLIEVDPWTGFTDCLTHAGGADHRPPGLRRNCAFRRLRTPVPVESGQMRGVPVVAVWLSSGPRHNRLGPPDRLHGS